MATNENYRALLAQGLADASPYGEVAAPDLQGYRIERKLGQGGMGSVYLAVDTALERRVALKIFDTGNMEPASLERFQQESRMMAKIDHPNVVGIFGTERASIPIPRSDPLLRRISRRISSSGRVTLELKSVKLGCTWDFRISCLAKVGCVMDFCFGSELSDTSSFHGLLNLMPAIHPESRNGRAECHCLTSRRSIHYSSTDWVWKALWGSTP